MHVYSIGMAFLLWAHINSGTDGHVSYIKCNGKNQFSFEENPQDCKNGSAFFIEDITFTRNSSYLDKRDKDSFPEKTFEATLRRNCSRKRTCKMASSLKYLEKYKCHDGSISNITVIHHCKLHGQNLSNGGVHTCGKFERIVSNKNTTVFVIKSEKIVQTGCTLKSHDDKCPIAIRTLQVDFGSECDTSNGCDSGMEITLDKNISKKSTIRSFDKTTFVGSNIELNIVMQTGLVWLEVNASSKYTINCKNDSDCTDDNKVAIIVLSLIAAIVTVILICVCAVSVCRVHVRVGVIQRWLPSTLQVTSEHTDDGQCSVDMTNQASTSATTLSHVTKTSATTFITELDLGVYSEIASVSRSSIYSHNVQVVLLPGTRRISSSSQREDERNPYSELEGNEGKIPGSGGTLCEPQSPSLIKNPPTFILKGSEFEDCAECGTTAEPTESDCSLTRPASKSDEKPPNSPNTLYNTQDSVGGVYSHLTPIGQQTKIISKN